MSSKVIGYCRISSKSQIDNNSLEQQEKEILNRYPGAKIYREQYTGTKLDRPVFKKMLEDLKPGDTLTVTKLDRLARSTVEGIETVQQLFKRGIMVHVLNVGLLEDNTMGKFFLTILLAIAEMERNTIIERTQAGKEIAKSKPGFKEGRPEKFNKILIDQALILLEDHSYNKVVAMTGISKSTLQRAKAKAQAQG